MILDLLGATKMELTRHWKLCVVPNSTECVENLNDGEEMEKIGNLETSQMLGLYK